MTRTPCLLVPFLLGIGLAAEAQVVPDAGTLLQQIERDRPLVLPKKATEDLRAPPRPMETMNGPAVTVTRFRFDGNKLMDDGALAAAVAPFLNRPLGFQELQRAAFAISEAYRSAGWIARAYLPRQEIDQGNVTIQIVEAVFGGARTLGAAPSRIGLDRVLKFVDAAQPVGQPLNADAMDRALLLIDDLPGVGASGNLAAGDRDNETVAVLKLTDKPLLSGDVGVDNTGGRSTGAWRETANLSLNSPLKLGDAALANLIHTEGSDYQRLAWQLPVGSSGWHAGASASHLSYRLVSAEFASLQANGTSDTAGLDASFPVVRSRFRNLFLTLNYDIKRFDNRAGGAVTSRYKADAGTLGLNGNLFDGFGGGGANSGGVSIEHGRLDLGGSPNQASDGATTRTAGAFTKLHYAASRQQALTESLSASASLAGQLASKNLDSSEKFYLGGSYGVRAYPGSEAGGSNGELINLELRARLPSNFSVTGFYDWGQVTVNKDNDVNGAAQVNRYSLRGAGVSAGWIAPFGLNVRATWARRIGSNPNPTPSGADQDGTLHKNRFWLTANLPF